MKNQTQSNEKLSQKELESMLPDYIFDRLSEEERTEFEIAIINYPALEKELQEGKELFGRIEQLDYKQILNDKTQYLPDRVVARLKKRNALYVEKKPNIRRLVITFIFAASMIIYMGIQNSFFNFLNNDNDNSNSNVKTAGNSLERQINSEQATSKFFSDLEKQFIAENLDETELLDDVSYDLNKFFDDFADSANIEYAVDGHFFQYYTSMIENLFVDMLYDSDFSYLVLLEDIENMDEKTFRTLINSMN